ncbi:hypothetical protein CACET_c12620 [Clostridium aceticum]|uniref:Uncharacterized protein n=1 Tax=Clostridium aceticum TaxID=84022 RepID=A0A0D8ICH1_9CLOT|nr:HEPN domain-containing protein [Clostridium aceticum]AKL94727.1 hypothetical protein CACET_c12620 [Clostridium aceticum]KJF27682.1 DNA-binding protein [Clostridium aceticum]
MVDTKRYIDWFKMALKDLNSAEILYKHDADLGIVCFHCQQAIEKYLKGYLIAQTGVLQEGHSLVKLCKKASDYDKNFKDYVKDCAFINTFYIETRYPAEDPMIVSKEEVEECLSITKSIIKYVDRLIEI